MSRLWQDQEADVHEPLWRPSDAPRAPSAVDVAVLMLAGFSPLQIARLERLRAEYPAREWVERMDWAWFVKWEAEEGRR